jgi:hypothetical protein
MDSPPWRRGPGRGAHGLGDRSGSSQTQEREVSDLPEVFLGPRKATVRIDGTVLPGRLATYLCA